MEPNYLRVVLKAYRPIALEATFRKVVDSEPFYHVCFYHVRARQVSERRFVD